ncbi:TPA: phage holin family protein, partial [Pseudomonas aeruginosa]
FQSPAFELGFFVSAGGALRCGARGPLERPYLHPFLAQPSRWAFSFPPRRGDIETMKMPEKDPSFWATVLLALREQGLAMGLAFILTWLRTQYEGKEPSIVRQLIEAALGAMLVMVVGLTAKEFGWSPAWQFFAAGFVGVLGVSTVQKLGARWAERKVG